ncbi:hypothetical protein LvStA_04458 [Burkholderia gladioli]|nr:hypothetical protein LvStA_04458 [Burkholderia gladioli]
MKRDAARDGRAAAAGIGANAHLALACLPS